jgi:TPR repeat protein
LNGDGVNKDLNEAARYFKLSADQGNVRARAHFNKCGKQ